MHSFVQIIELFCNILFFFIQLVVVAAVAVIFLENVIIFPIDFFLCYYTLISIVAGLGRGNVVTEIAENENKGNKHFVCLQLIWGYEASLCTFKKLLDACALCLV